MFLTDGSFLSSTKGVAICDALILLVHMLVKERLIHEILILPECHTPIIMWHKREHVEEYIQKKALGKSLF